MEEAVEDACVDMHDEEPVPQDVPLTRTTRSGRNVRHHNYKNISRNDIQMAQMKRSLQKGNSGMSSKRIKRRMKEVKMLSGKGSTGDLFRRLTGAMFGQISKDGKFANTHLSEGMERHGEKLIEALLTELSQLDNMKAFSPLRAGKLSKKDRKRH